jgi:hypothetical protein
VASEGSSTENIAIFKLILTSTSSSTRNICLPPAPNKDKNDFIDRNDNLDSIAEVPENILMRIARKIVPGIVTRAFQASATHKLLTKEAPIREKKNLKRKLDDVRDGEKNVGEA